LKHICVTPFYHTFVCSCCFENTAFKIRAAQCSKYTPCSV